MAQDKKSFLLYCDLIHVVEQLTDEQAGSLFKHILQYVNDKNPVSDSVITKIAFEPIKQQLKRDLVKYEDIRKRNSDNAKKRWDATAYERIRIDTKNADSVNDTDNDKDKDINKKVTFVKPTLDELRDYMLSQDMLDVSNKFFDFYESKGWLIGKNKMKDWKSAVRTWKPNHLKQAQVVYNKPKAYNPSNYE
jgi:hypothetical protein